MGFETRRHLWAWAFLTWACGNTAPTATPPGTSDAAGDAATDAASTDAGGDGTTGAPDARAGADSATDARTDGAPTDAAGDAATDARAPTDAVLPNDAAIRPDALPPDVGVRLDFDAGPDALPPDPEQCAAVCDRLGGCVAGPENVCPTLTAGGRAAFDGDCRSACASVPGLALRAAQTESCGALTAVVAEAAPALGERCDGLLRVTAGCDALSSTLAECWAAQCGGGRGLTEGARALFARACMQSVNDGGVSDAHAATYAALACDSADLRDLMARYAGDLSNGGSPLARICQNGPAVPPATCAAACEHLGACGLDGTRLSDGASLCIAQCAFGLDDADVYTCAAPDAVAGDCATAETCRFGGPPPADPCVTMFDRVFACGAVACPNLSVVQDYAQAAFTRVYCDVHVAPSVTADTPCDDPAITDALTLALTGPRAAFGPFCSTGPYVDGPTCATACDAVLSCGDGLGFQRLWASEVGLCRLNCLSGGADTLLPGVWRCVAESGAECGAVGTCLGL